MLSLSKHRAGFFISMLSLHPGTRGPIRPDGV